jgi:four helix bundle protein
MLRIYEDILAWLEWLVRLIEQIGRHDPDLARQLRRASSGVALNTAEGMAARGRAKSNCYNIALREARESFAALQVAERLKYQPIEAPVEDLSSKIIGTLVRLSVRRA